MKTIGIIGAMSEEITYLKEKIEIVTTKNIIGLDFHVGKYCGNSIVLVISGIGKVNAAVCTQVLIDHFGVDYIINTGCAGAIHPELGIGDILISTDAVQHDMDVSALGDPIGTIPRLAESYFRADEMLVKLALTLGVSTDYLLGLDGRKTLDVSGLPLSVVGHLQLLIEDIKAK